MRIVIDMQGAQSTGSRNRGIGHYTLSLAQAIIRNRAKHEVFLALNGLLHDTIEPIRTVFDGLLPQDNIRVWQIPGPVHNLNGENNWRQRTAELVREAFLASLEPDIVLLSSLFEGLDDNAVTSIGVLSRNVPTAVILYDLIPLIYRDLYLKNPVVEAWYENKLAHLRRADLLLAISESSRQENIHYLGFPPEATINVSTAAEPQFQPLQLDAARAAEIRRRYGLRHPFIMYTGGIDHRKNIDGLIRAYAKLSHSLRALHQLAVICSVQSSSRAALERLAKEHRLRKDELVLTGFVPEADLLALYNLCKVFVFPSWHEGFGLPALEAMSCGRAVIAANTSSLPEVIGRDDALFDPRSDDAIAEKLLHVLTNDDFRSELERHGLEQAKRFSWDTSARRTITAFESWHAINRKPVLSRLPLRLKLAYVSPLPPERSGVADYSAELLPELSRHYDIDVVVAQDSVSDPWVKANCPVRSVEWFRAHADCYDRVLYHLGNSQFHQHMFSLLEEVPGVVVLHDFFLSGIVAHMDSTGYKPSSLAKALYQSHGYPAVQQLFQTLDPTEVIWRYPCNLEVLQNALGIIVHAENSRRLAKQWYGEHAMSDWAVIPHLRVPAQDRNRAKAREVLNLNDEDFVVCSFGLLGSTKLNQRLLDAWLTSALAKDAHCVLVFVGENDGGDYGAHLLRTIEQSGLPHRIRITGWADVTTFRRYLAAADVSVQLRTLSRGETSGTVLDCMSYGLPTIVNIHGSMANLPDDGVWKLPDEFVDAELVGALETLWRDPFHRRQLGERAREIIHTHHAPRNCADLYVRTIETMYTSALTDVSALTRALTRLEPSPTEAHAWVSLAEAITLSIPPRVAQQQLLVDISGVMRHDSKDSTQYAVHSLLRELLTHPPEGYRVEPVYTLCDQRYRYARRFALRFLGCPESALTDDAIEFRIGDFFWGLDLEPQAVVAQRAFYQRLRNYGVRVQLLVYDLMPSTSPKTFLEESATQRQAWLKIVAESDGAICISDAVADELRAWIKTNRPALQRPFKINAFNLTTGLDASSLSNELSERYQAGNEPSNPTVGISR